jgi:hypothetical protein
LGYWSVIRGHLSAYRVVMIEQDLAQLHLGLVHRLRLVDFGRMLREGVEVRQPNAVQLLLAHVVPAS